MNKMNKNKKPKEISKIEKEVNLVKELQDTKKKKPPNNRNLIL